MTNRTSRKALAEFALATGIASLACGVLHLITDMGWLVAAPALVFGVLGVVLGIAALRKGQPRGMAVTGIVTGAIGFLFIVAVFLFALLFLGVLTGEAM